MNVYARLLACGLALAATSGALAGGFDLSWYTIDGGGAMFTAGGSFELSGTIGQPDAGMVTGGGFGLAGGFWGVGGAGAPCDPCDMNCDGATDSFDIEPFLGVLFGGDTPCSACAGDINSDGAVDSFDIELFIECLFGG